MKLYHKLFFSTTNKTQLIVAGCATFIGFLLLLIGVNYVFQIYNFRAKNELLTDNVFVVQRKVSSGGAFRLQKTDFNANDQEFIKNQPFIEHFQPLTVNNFDIDFQLADENMPYMRTDIFIQGIHPEFLDVKNIDWSWDSTKKIVPIIIPKEFLIMMNSFMSSKDMPQISEDLAKTIHFKFNLKKNDQRESFECRVVGFTSIFSAVLVPESFIQYGSEKYGTEKEKITQLILSHTKENFGTFKKFLEENYLETKSTDLVMSQIKSMTLILFNFIVALAFIIILLSATIFSQYSQLLIESKKFEIRTMLRLGHKVKTIVSTLYNYFFRLILIINLLVLVTFLGLLFLLNSYFVKYGFDFQNLMSFHPFWMLAFINFVLLFAIRRKILSIVKQFN